MSSDQVIWVTGANGFVGRHLVRRLEREGLQVVALKRKDLDLRDRGLVQQRLILTKPRLIIHLAGATERTEKPEIWQRQKEDTFLAGQNLLEEAVQQEIPYLLMVGSVDELGYQRGVLSPDLPSKPHTTYGLYKSLLREFGEFLTRRAPVQIDWFRPFTVYGPGEPQRFDMLIPFAFRAAIRGEEAAFTPGTHQRDFLYVEDLVDWIFFQIKKINLNERPPAGQFRIHHVGTGVGTSVRDILHAICEEFPNARFHLGKMPERSHEPDLQIAPKLGDWEPKIPWREGIRRTAIWWREQMSC